jgi:hypothetical protein
VVAHFDAAAPKALAKGDLAALERLESGGVLAESRVLLRTAASTHTVLDGPHVLGPRTVYLPAGSSSPGWFLSAAPYIDDPGRTDFSVFERASAAAPWRKSLETVAQAHVLSAPVLVNGTLQPATQDQVGQATSAVTAVATYLETDKAPALLTETVLAESDAGVFPIRQQNGSDFESGALSCRPDASSLIVVPTVDLGTQAFASLACTTTWRAKPGYSIIAPDFVRPWTARLAGRHLLEYNDVAQVAVSVRPDGTAELIGYSRGVVGVTVR